MRVGTALLVVALAAGLGACTGSARTDGAAPSASGSSTTARSTTSLRPKATTAPGSTRPLAQGLEGSLIDPYQLKVGDCFNHYTHYQNFQPLEIYTVRSCTVTHDAEVFYVTAYTATTDNRFPGRDVLRRFATKVCYEEFTKYVGMRYETSTYKLDFLLPSQDRWESTTSRVRTVTCFLTKPPTKLVASARNSNT